MLRLASASTPGSNRREPSLRAASRSIVPTTRSSDAFIGRPPPPPPPAAPRRPRPRRPLAALCALPAGEAEVRGVVGVAAEVAALDDLLLGQELRQRPHCG